MEQMTPLNMFEFVNAKVRVFERDGAPWWVARDVCAILGIGNSRQCLTYLDDDEKGVITVDTPGGAQKMATINEPGLYSLIMHSRKPEAQAFKRWIVHDVLPALRKTGSYQMTQTMGGRKMPTTYPEALEYLAHVEREKEQRRTRLAVQWPPVASGEA